MLGAGLLARNAVARGLQRKPWVKTSLAPGSLVVTEYLDRAGPDRAARAARLQPRRLRLHDLHRQLRAAPRRGLRGGQRPRPRRRLRALGQPQLRGAHQPRRQDELPRLAAARRRLRAGRHDGHRPRQRAARHRRRGGGRVPARLCGPPSTRSPRRSTRRCSRTCSARATPHVYEGDERWRSLTCRPATASSGTTASTYVRQPPYFEGLPAQPAPVRGPRGRSRAGACSATASPPITSRRPGSIKRDGPAGPLPAGARGGTARLQLLRLAARQPRGHDARHVREHPPAQPHRRRRVRSPRAA